MTGTTEAPSAAPHAAPRDRRSLLTRRADALRDDRHFAGLYLQDDSMMMLYAHIAFDALAPFLLHITSHTFNNILIDTIRLGTLSANNTTCRRRLLACAPPLITSDEHLQALMIKKSAIFASAAIDGRPIFDYAKMLDFFDLIQLR